MCVCGVCVCVCEKSIYTSSVDGSQLIVCWPISLRVALGGGGGGGGESWTMLSNGRHGYIKLW